MYVKVEGATDTSSNRTNKPATNGDIDSGAGRLAASPSDSGSPELTLASPAFRLHVRQCLPAVMAGRGMEARLSREARDVPRRRVRRRVRHPPAEFQGSIERAVGMHGNPYRRLDPRASTRKTSCKLAHTFSVNYALYFGADKGH